MPSAHEGILGFGFLESIALGFNPNKLSYFLG